MANKSRKLTKTEQEQLVESYKSDKRMNFNGEYYFNILMDAVKQYKAHEKEADDLFDTSKKNGTITLIWYLKNAKIRLKMKHNELIAVTFAAMLLECMIWDYAAVNTSQTLTEDFLSKLSLLGKWKVIPKLVNNDKKIKIDDVAIRLLKKLEKERNNIVHSKSKAVPDTYDEIIRIKNKPSTITIPETVMCVNKCIEAIKKVDTTNYWLFEKEVKHTFKLPVRRTFKDKKTNTTLLTS